ncbi:MAG TPA: sugar transferase [Gaiellaceae bacterium]|nr:sugar transferase [Gaiellaceae bacterium]
MAGMDAGVEPRAFTLGARRVVARARDVRPWTRTTLAVDALMLFAAVVVADLGAPRAGVPSTPAFWLVAFPLLTLGFMAVRGLYRPRVFLRVLDDLRIAVTATALAAMIVLSLRVLVADDPWVAAQTARIWAFASVYLLAGRIVLSWGELRARRRGESVRPTLVVGAGKVGRLTAARLLQHPELGLKPVGYLDKEPLEGRWDDGLPVLGASWDLDRIVAEHRVRHVVLSFSTAPQSVLLSIMRRCQELGVEVSMVPRFYEKVVGHIGIEYIGGLPLMTAQPTNPRSWHFAVKYGVDRVVAAFLLLLVAPVLLAAAAGVWLTMGRPIFFRQERAGRDGRVFEMLKFRSMRPPRDGEVSPLRLEPGTAPGGVEGEDRRTRLGALLRRTSLDELPQLWNVLRGDMSLVGPRPERPEYVEVFSRKVYRYGERNRVKAGITGWAQVNGLRGKTSLEDRVEWDNYYIENWSLWLDVKILLLTCLAVVRPSQAE